MTHPSKQLHMQLECNPKMSWIRHQFSLTSQNEIRLSPIENNSICEDFIHTGQNGV